MSMVGDGRLIALVETGTSDLDLPWATPVALWPWSSAIASASLPACVRRVTSPMSIFENAFMIVIFRGRRRCRRDACSCGGGFVEVLRRCGRPAPPSRPGWPGKRRGPARTRWRRGRVPG
jgi:hypothetical protein